MLMRSGIGPAAELLPHGIDVRVENDAVGSNLQEHWVCRFKSHVAQPYAYSFWYPQLMGRKLRYKDLAIGFGKCQIAGRNLFSIAMADCKSSGRVHLQSGKSFAVANPDISISDGQFQSFFNQLHEVATSLSKHGVHLDASYKTITKGSMKPNWHYCGTAAIGAVVDEEFRVKGIQRLYIADNSVLRCIPSFNVQITAYLAAYLAAEQIR